MNCGQAKKLLHDFSADFLAEKRALQLEAHLAGCAPCRERLRELCAVDELVAADRLTADRRLVAEIMLQTQQAQIWRYYLRHVLIKTAGHLLAGGLAAAALLHARPWLAGLLHPVTTGEFRWEQLTQPLPGIALIATLAMLAVLILHVMNWLLKRAA